MHISIILLFIYSLVHLFSIKKIIFFDNKVDLHSDVADKTVDLIKSEDYIASSKKLKNFYNEREIKHLYDVNRLYHSVKNILLLSAILFIPTSVNINFKKLLFFLCFLVLLLVLNIIYFEGCFYLFHKIFFKDETWIFDKNKEVLSKIFPINFWKYTFIKYQSYFAISIFIIMLIEYYQQI